MSFPDAPGWSVETLHDDFIQGMREDRVLYDSKTGHQRLRLFENARFGRVLTLDGVVQVTEADEFIYHEMLTHVPILAHGAVERVLIIGGGDGGMAREALRHKSVEQVTMVEIDRGVITDASGNAFVGLYQAMYEFQMADTVAPSLVSQVPINGATDVASTTSVTLTFNEVVAVASVGTVTLTPGSLGGSAVVVSPQSGGRITATGNTVTVVMSGGLTPNQTVETYSVTVSSGLITDVAGNSFDGNVSGYTFSLADTTAPGFAC